MAPDPIFEQQARSILRQRGQRVTAPRATVLAALLSAQAAARATQGSAAALSHQDLSQRFDASGEGAALAELDRVTLYRILEWLVEIGLAHKVAGEDRVFRFSLNEADEHRPESGHAHFHCLDCRAIFCLPQSPAWGEAVPLPTGFVGKELAVTLRGWCPACMKKRLS